MLLARVEECQADPAIGRAVLSAPEDGDPGLRAEIGATLRLAAPVILAQLGMMLMGIVDTAMVGRLPGEDALAAVSVGNAFLMTITLFVGGILVALDPIVAQAVGADRKERCGEALWTGLWIGLAAAIPVTLLFLDVRWLLVLARQEPEIVEATGAYLHGRAFAVLPFLLFAAFRGFLNGLADVRAVLVIAVLANAVNVVADWALIFGHLGMPALGVAGAGYATSVSRWFMLVAIVVVVARPRYRIYDLRPRLPRPGQILEILRVGAPIGAQISAEVGIFSAVSIAMGWIGKSELAAHQIALSLASLTFMIPLGLGIAASVRVGQLVGSDDLDGAARAGRVAIILGGATMACSAIAFAVAPGLLAAVFTSDAAVIAAAVVFVRMAAAFQIFDGIQTVATGCLRGAGDTRTPFLANLIAHWAVGLPLGAWLAFGTSMGGPGLWVGLTVGLVGVAVVLARRFLVGSWRARARIDRAA